MPDPQPNPRKSLTEISHLFLSDVRESASGGVRPMRLPPGAPRPSEPAQRGEIGPVGEQREDLDPRPRSSQRQPASDVDSAEPMPTVKPVRALVVGHLNGTQVQRSRQYARHLAAGGPRVGMIEIGGAEMRLCCFDRSHSPGGGQAEDSSERAVDFLQSCDVRHASESLAELAWDVDLWLLLVTDTRCAEARQLLAGVSHWVLLSTCDHDGVVSCYRSIKGLAGKSPQDRPRLSLAVLNAQNPDEARRVHRKIAGVCEQFLNWPLEAESAVPPAEALAAQVGEHPVLVCRPSDAATSGSLWQAVGAFLGRATAERGGGEAERAAESARMAESLDSSQMLEEPIAPLPPLVEPAPVRAESWRDRPVRINAAVEAAEGQRGGGAANEPDRLAAVTPMPPNDAERANVDLTGVQPAATAEESEVTELAAGQQGPAAVLAAVLNQRSLGLVASPVHPPAAPEAVLAVGRDRRLVLLAIAGNGLSELRALGQAYQWVIENRPLLSMALPQLAIDAHAMPALRLLVDRRDLAAEQLQPLLQSGNVIVHTYRKLRWGERTGVLLEAA